MANWWELPNQSNNQFALPTWGSSQQAASPDLFQAPQVDPAGAALAASGQPAAGVGAPGAGGLWGGGNLWGALGSTNKDGIRSDGWGGMALGAAQGLAGAFMGAKQYQLAQDGLKENKRQFSLNFDNQRKTVNTELEDRQRARVASSPSAYQSVGDYMTKNGV